MRTPKPLFLIILGGSFMCHSTKNASESITAVPADTKKPVIQLSPIAPEYARINAVIKSINPIEPSGKEPCNRFPCFADVIIREVVGVGSSFSHNLKTDDQIQVQFVHSLARSQDAFPDKQTIHLPGITLGQSFIADIEGSPFEKNKPVFKIYSYRLTK